MAWQRVEQGSLEFILKILEGLKEAVRLKEMQDKKKAEKK